VVIGGNHVPHFSGTGNVEMSVVKQQVGSENSMPEHMRADIQICKEIEHNRSYRGRRVRDDNAYIDSHKKLN
jgi:hypothetical protein